MWAYQMVPLSERLRCVAYDRRGQGRSSRSGDGYDYDTLADDLAALLDTLDLRGVTLVGMSMAGGEYEGAPHGLMFTHADRLNADLLACIGG